jgi:threonine/homoserine/homoserine lactone efflux protein
LRPDLTVHGYWAQFAKVAVAHLLAVASPGPDFAMVVRQSLAHGRRAAVWTSIGIGTAILVHATYALLGIGILLRTYPVALVSVKFLGAGYLAWIGARALTSRPRRGMAGAPAGAEAELSGPAEPAPGAAWTTGFLTNAFNPKVTLFFVAIFASLIDPATPKLIQAGYGLWMSGTTMAWFSMVSVFFTRDEVRRAFLRGGHWIDRAMGVVLIGLAAALAAASVG